MWKSFSPSALLDPIRARWCAAKPGDAPALAPLKAAEPAMPGPALLFREESGNLRVVGANEIGQQVAAMMQELPERLALDGGAGLCQRVVRTMHAALGRRLLVLLDSHVSLLSTLV